MESEADDSNNSQLSEESNDRIVDDEENDFSVDKKKFTWKTFLKKNGITLSLLLFSSILMIVGLIVYYVITGSLTQNAGFWLILIGVILFLLTTIFGFERIDF